MESEDFRITVSEAKGYCAERVIGTLVDRICAVVDPIEDSRQLNPFLRTLRLLHRALVSHYSVAPYIASAGLDSIFDFVPLPTIHAAHRGYREILLNQYADAFDLMATAFCCNRIPRSKMVVNLHFAIWGPLSGERFYPNAQMLMAHNKFEMPDSEWAAKLLETRRGDLIRSKRLHANLRPDAEFDKWSRKDMLPLIHPG